MDVIFTTAGCNNASQCMTEAVASSDGTSRIAYAASTSLAIASFSPNRTPVVTASLHGHQARISSVHWKHGFLLSGDAAGRMRLHVEVVENGKSSWQSQDVATCASSISALTSISTASQSLFIAATSNGQVLAFGQGETTPRWTLSLGERHIVETMATIVDATNGTVWLALGGVDMLVHLYEITDDTGFVHVESLPGHKGWVRGLAFSVDDNQPSDILLASASQDHKIRLWRIPSTRQVSFDAMLVGHEDWVTAVSWVRPGLLLSSSMDNRMILWQLDESHVWTPQTRVGDLGGTGLLSSAAISSTELISLTFNGQLHRWVVPQDQQHFEPRVGITGHTATVTDVVWSPLGDYVVSVSLDQTARAFSNVHGATWIEISRAQVHGYDINCACFINERRFVSGADEKILRVFDVPEGLSALLQGHTSTSGFGTVPELSLTTKAVSDKQDDAQDASQPAIAFVGEQLNRLSVWPEVQKLYGHGNELLCVTSNHAKTRLASACKARDETSASIWIWNTSSHDIQPTQQLPGHASSVVQLAFSHDDKYLLSVSKDRHWCLYERQDDKDGLYALACKQKAHKRIIWSCDWSPDDVFFVTGSRDDTLMLWTRSKDSSAWQPAAAPMIFSTAVTAVAFAKHKTVADGYLLAIGLESGSLQVVSVVQKDDSIETHVLESQQIHGASITRLAWHPTSHLVATSSADSAISIVQVTTST
ncbi:hypothetical protein LEN26_009433 [Aphanomyces euteiches]|nr:hypothetical protein LEN26_009433 [Aphanomyces euteiches]